MVNGVARQRDPLGLSIEVVTTMPGLLALKDDYDQLGIAAKNTLPFGLHEWHVSWWNNFATSSPTIRDSLFIHVVRNAAGRCIAIVPLVYTKRPSIGPLHVGVVSFLGADPYITEIRTPLVDPVEGANAAWAVSRSLAADPRWDWVHWSGINAVPDFGDTIALATPLERHEPTVDYVLDLAPSWEQFRAGLKRNIRESLRHCYNSLKRDNLEYSLEVARTPTEVRRGVEDFLRLHETRANLRGTVQHPNRFATQTSQRFLFEVTRRLAERGVARVFMLRVAGRIVTARVAFEVGDSLYLYYSGFDPEWGKYSVMTTTVAEAIKYAIDRRLATVNLSAGTDVSKTRWGARAVSYDESIEPGLRVRSRLAYAMYRRALGSRAAPRALVPLLKMLPRRAWA